jgi:hypothetical protein
MQVPSILQGESLKRLLQGAVAGAIATIFVGFNWERVAAQERVAAKRSAPVSTLLLIGISLASAE